MRRHQPPLVVFACQAIIFALGALIAATAFAAVDFNGRQSELESINARSDAFDADLGDRNKGPFKDWNALTTRVRCRRCKRAKFS